MSRKNNMLIILDGFGIGKDYDGNAIYLAKKPTLDFLFSNYPHNKIYASGEEVGLPQGQMGNSEVGHLNIGAGRIVYQNLLKINNSIKDGSFFKNEVLKNGLKKAYDNQKALHLMGLLSDGGVHSHEEHLYALLKLAKAMNLNKVYIHVFLDGRDVSPHQGKDSIKKLIEKTDEIGIGEIATISGRYYSMDRDKNWARTELSYDAIVSAKGIEFKSPVSLIENFYKRDITDEFIEPCVSENYEGIEDGDTVVFFNFRPDRARQITRAVTDDEFSGFVRKKAVKTDFITMTNYDSTISNVKVVFDDEIPKNTIGEYMSSLNLKQLRIAETEKYAHVTFFLNGGKEVKFEGEDRILVSSPKVATFDLKPEMSAFEVTEKLVEEIKKKKYDLIVLNFANPDMVGHTGNIPAAVKAVETVDFCLKNITDALLETNGTALITADHGNCEYMKDDLGNPVTSHTTNLVPIVLFNYDKGAILKDGGRLCDLAPTILDMMNLEKPEEMTGNSILIRR